MRIIISEDKFINTIKKLYDNEGFDNTSNILGINKIKLAQILNIPIKGDDFYDEHEAVAYMFLSDLVNMNKQYKNCELKFYRRDQAIQWICYWNNNGEGLDTLSWSPPYYSGNKTEVSTSYLSSTDGEYSYDARNDDESFDGFENPEGFNNVDELVEWFKNVYLPTTYEMIENHYDLLLPSYEKIKN